MASGRVPRTAMTLQGFGNCVHSKGGGRTRRGRRPNHRRLPEKNHSTKFGKRARPLYQPSSMFAYSFESFRNKSKLRGYSVNRQIKTYGNGLYRNQLKGRGFGTMEREVQILSSGPFFSRFNVHCQHFIHFAQQRISRNGFEEDSRIRIKELGMSETSVA